MTTTAHEHARARRPLLGLRRQPGRLALAVMRMPRPLYHRGWGWMLDHTFLLIAHQGRKTGKRRETVAMALAYDPETREAVVCSAWGPNTEWIRNLRAHPALQIQIGRESYVPRAAIPLGGRERRCGGGVPAPPSVAETALRGDPRLGRSAFREGTEGVRADAARSSRSGRRARPEPRRWTSDATRRG